MCSCRGSIKDNAVVWAGSSQPTITAVKLRCRGEGERGTGREGEHAHNEVQVHWA